MAAPSRRFLVFPDGRRVTFPFACGSCGALWNEGADGDRCRRDLHQRLGGSSFLPDPDAPYGLDTYTLRTAATRLRLGIRPVDEAGRRELAEPHGERAGRAALVPLGREQKPVSLGVLCRPVERDAVLDRLPDAAGWTDDVAILVDTPAVSAPRDIRVAGFAPGAVRIAGRPLAEDFAGQRNALAGLARHGWFLQLDADEWIDPEVAALLPALAAFAEEGDILSVGLPRRNLVDGILSDVFPDTQYRLNRAGIRFAGRVHERPVLPGGWKQSFISLHGAIEHRLAGAHVRSRSARYESIDPGRGRPEEEDALLRPYRA